MYGKILIRCDLEVRTGMHIGGSSAFSAIGAVDSPVVRDPYTGYPIVPGSSLKGKLRTLLARSTYQDIEAMAKAGSCDKDPEQILRLFGSSEPVRRSRLQFAYSGSKQNVKLTMCAGKMLYEDGEFKIGEEPAVIYKKANEIIESMKD